MPTSVKVPVKPGSASTDVNAPSVQPLATSKVKAVDGAWMTFLFEK